MKIFFLIIGLICAVQFSYAQQLTIDPSTNQISYEDIVQTDSTSALDLLKLTKRWAISVFGAGKDMIDYYDETDRLIIIKPIIECNTFYDFRYGPVTVKTMNEYTFYHKLEIETKDSRYRIVASNFMATVKSTSGSIADRPRSEKKPAHEVIFFNEDFVRSGAAAIFPNNKRRQEEYIGVIRKEKDDLQRLFDDKIKDEFVSLKRFLMQKPKKDW